MHPYGSGHQSLLLELITTWSAESGRETGLNL